MPRTLPHLSLVLGGRSLTFRALKLNAPSPFAGFGRTLPHLWFTSEGAFAGLLQDVRERFGLVPGQVVASPSTGESRAARRAGITDASNPATIATPKTANSWNQGIAGTTSATLPRADLAPSQP